MATEIYLGYPPQHVIDWIRNHSQPAGHPETRFTLQGGTVETYNITGTLDQQWMIDHGFFDNNNWQWLKNITEIDIGNTVTSIGENAFYECSSLTSITIPNQVTSIGEFAFGDCNYLTNITIGNNVSSIGTSAFYGCAMTSLVIPSSIMSVGNAAFASCGQLTAITVLEKTTSDAQTLLEDADVPAGCTIIGELG